MCLLLDITLPHIFSRTANLSSPRQLEFSQFSVTYFMITVVLERSWFSTAVIHVIFGHHLLFIAVRLLPEVIFQPSLFFVTP